MATPDTITVTQLARLIGTPDAPLILDVRTTVITPPIRVCCRQAPARS